jgi:hypothetical protein
LHPGLQEFLVLVGWCLPDERIVAAVGLGRTRRILALCVQREGGSRVELSADKSAPVYGSGSVDAAAPVEVVWRVMTEVERWPEWNPDVRDAAMDGALAEGTTFRWKAGPGTIRSTLRAVQPMHLLAWTGKTLGIPAVHVYRLESRGGLTTVSTEESWSGLLARVFRSSLQRTLQKAIDTGLDALKREAERQAAAEEPR